MVVITDSYISKFGEFYDKDLVDLSEEAINSLETNLDNIDAVFVGNMMGSKLYNMNQLGVAVRDRVQMDVPFFNYTLACASGGMAFYRAFKSVEAGEFDKVIVLGVEKMTDFSSCEITEALMGASDFENEYLFGLTFAALYGLMASRYLHEYKKDPMLLDKISMKAHSYALSNSNAQFHRELKDSDFEKSVMVSRPLKLLHCSPFTDGVSAVVISKEGEGVEVVDVQMAQDSLALKDRDSIISINSTNVAANKLYEATGIDASMIDMFEIHDCFSIAETMIYEDLGLSERGQGIDDAAEDKFNVNISGGLKACGHPVGATGVKQIAYLFENMKIDSYGLAQNMAGTGNTSFVTLLKK